MKPTLKKVIINILFLMLASFIAVLTIIQNVKIFKHSDLNSIYCGWPLNFIMQNQGWRDPPYPWKVPCFTSPLESPTIFYWQYFIFDTFFFYLIIIAPVYGRNLIIKLFYKGRT